MSFLLNAKLIWYKITKLKLFFIRINKKFCERYS